MYRSLLFFLLMHLSFYLAAQDNYILTLTVKDSKTDEILPGAVVREIHTGKAISTDANGKCQFILPKSDSLKIEINFTGYKRLILNVNPKIQHLDVRLEADIIELKEVVINANSNKEKLESTQMSMETVTIQTAKMLPVLLGEVDILKVFQLKPGIQSGNEGSTGLYVRGGGPEQNLFLVDDATVYNPYHLFGFFSVFNSDVVSKVDLYKGGFPAQYGGRLSSVIDVKLRDGDKDKYHVSGGIGTIASRLAIEGPIQKGKSSFLIAGRRTYIEPITRYVNKQNEGKDNYDPIPDYNFQDLNLKFSYKVRPKDKITLTGYYGRDNFNFVGNSYSLKFNWGNLVGSYNWQHTFNSKLYTNTTISFSDYNYKISNRFDNFSLNVTSGVRDYTIKNDWNYTLSNKHTVKAGINVSRYEFNVGLLNAGTDDGKIRFGTGQSLIASGFGVYLGDEYTLNPRWKFDAGIRFSGFHNRKTYTGFEPRISTRYKVNENISLKANYTRMLQYVHLATNSGSSLPTDIWYPSSPNVAPEKGNQAAAGINISLFEGRYFLSNEIYYKWMNNQIDFKDGAQLFVNPNLEQEFIYGKGWAYGNEIYLEKKTGKLTGWVGYTLAWTWRQFNGGTPETTINNGQPFHPKYDRRNDITVVAMYELNKRLSCSLTWIYGTGTLISLPTGRMLVQDVNGKDVSFVPIYGERNNYRIPAYHRMDISIIWKMGKRTDLTLSVYNVYNRRNTYIVYLDSSTKGVNINSTFVAKQISLFPIIPSLTFNFKF